MWQGAEIIPFRYVAIGREGSLKVIESGRQNFGPIADCPELELQKPEAAGSAARFLMGLLAVRLLKLCNQRLDLFLSLARLGDQFINRRQLLCEQIDRHAA